MTNDHVEQAYGSRSGDIEALLGTEVSAHDPDRNIIEPWAARVGGPILDVGSGTGRWSGHLVANGHEIEGLEPVKPLLERARKSFPEVTFHRGTIEQLAKTDRRWSGILAWYSVIHLGQQRLPDALAALWHALDDDGTLLLSFFSGPTMMPFDHPVAPAYMWPMDQMTQAVETAGFRIVDQHWVANAPHAHIIADAVGLDRFANARPREHQ